MKKFEIVDRCLKISIGIPAFNEQDNISNLIQSILEQKEEGYFIEDIIIASDGSTDNTVNIVRNFNNPKIKLIEDIKRKGKPSRINQIVKIFKGDLLMFLDADSLPGDEFVLGSIANSFKQNPQVKLFLTRAIPLPALTYTETAINNFFFARESLIKEFDYRNTIFAARGSGMALSRDFAKRINLPKDVLNDDAYIFLLCKLWKLKVKYVPGAVIWYRSAQSIQDYNKQVIRYVRGGMQLDKLFPEGFVKTESFYPKRLMLKIMLLQLFKNALLYMFLRFNTQYCQLYVKYIKENGDIKWSMVKTSKSLLSNEQRALNMIDLTHDMLFREIDMVKIVSNFYYKIQKFKIVKH